MRARHSGLLLFARYVAASLVPVLLLGAIVDLYARHKTREQLLAQAARQAEGITQATFAPYGAALVDGFDAVELLGMTQLLQSADSSHEAGLMCGLRLWTVQGQRLAAMHDLADAPASITERAFYDAAAGDVSIVEGWPAGVVGPPGAAAGTVATVYVPVSAATGAPPVLVVELVVPMDQTGLAAAQAQLRVVMVVAVVALWLVLAAMTRRVTARLQRSAAEMRRLALFDPLTGIANRQQFTDEANRAFAAHAAHGQPTAVVLLDLLGFTQVNRALGRTYGDELLRYVAQRLQSVVQPGQLVARVGGDVFGLLLPGLDGPAALGQLAVVQHALGAEVEVAGIPVSFEAVMGVASHPADGADADTVLQHADLALGAAKATQAPARVFSADLDHDDPARLGLAAQLRRAIANNELFLVYQPKIDLVDLQVRSVEALVRWNHPERGPVPPSQFVPVAEGTDLIVPLTAWVMETAVAQAAYWAYNGMPLRVSINISARNLRDDLLPEQLLRTLLNHNLPPDYIELEITETAIIAEPERAARTIRRLRDAGVAVALDDFGQGATSLAHLRHLRLSTLKIDKSFIDNVCTDPVDASIVYAMIALGHQLGLEVVAEGVESEAQYLALASWGCDVAQGFHFARPLTVDQLQKRFGRRAAEPAGGVAGVPMSGGVPLAAGHPGAPTYSPAAR
ncbi:MAG: putative bifunctional diguanylate cyclase/phosphodiesterase [Acidimicrobiia bacterium]